MQRKKLIVKGHYFINFINCTIWINNITFSNELIQFKQTFIIPPSFQGVVTEKMLTFEDIELQNIKNTKEIKELKFHKIVNGSLWSIFFAITFITLIIIFIQKRKEKTFKVTIQANENQSRNKIAQSAQINETAV